MTSSSPTTITRPAATSIRNDTIRCFRKLRCFSTPHASLTALVIAPKTPSDDQISARLPATPTWMRRLAERVELRGDKVEARREVAEDEGEDGEPLVFARGDRAEQRDDQEQEREQREERVVRDRGRVRQVVAVDELDEPAPGGTAGQRSSLRRESRDHYAGTRTGSRFAGSRVRGFKQRDPANPMNQRT